MDPDEKTRLLEALRQPVAGLTVVQVESVAQARELTAECESVLGGRTHAVVSLIAESGQEHALLNNARAAVRDWAPDQGVLFLVDETPNEPAIAFWQALNMQREHWGAFSAHVIFLLRPASYRLLGINADHLYSWIPLKFDLRKIGNTANPRHSTIRDGMAPGSDPRSVRLTLRLLEEDLNEYLAQAETEPKVLVNRFYVPMTLAAIQSNDVGRAEALYKQIDEELVNDDSLPNWWESITYLSLRTNQLNRAESAARCHLELGIKKHDDALRAISLYLIGRVAEARFEIDVAERSYRQSLELEERLGDEVGAATTCHQLGILSQQRRDFEAAEQWYIKSLKIRDLSGDLSGKAASYHQLGILSEERRDLETAEEWFRKSLEISKHLKDEYGIAVSSHQLGIVAFERGEYETAEQWYKDSLKSKEHLGDEPGLASTYHQLGILSQARQDFETAIEWYSRSIKICEDKGMERDAASTYLQLGTLKMLQCEYEVAEQWYRRSLKIKNKMGDKYGTVIVYFQLGRLYEARKNLHSAGNNYVQALRFASGENDDSRQNSVLLALLNVYRQTTADTRCEIQKEWTRANLEQIGDLDELAQMLEGR